MKITIYDHTLTFKKIKPNKKGDFVNIVSDQFNSSINVADGDTISLTHDVPINIFNLLQLVFTGRIIVGKSYEELVKPKKVVKI